jgi:hypothetical protein
MNIYEHVINCSHCGKKIGLLTETINGTNHTLAQSLLCMSCLPEMLEAAEKRQYNPELIKEIREWMNEPSKAEEMKNV